jgi:hypothetical protein
MLTRIPLILTIFFFVFLTPTKWGHDF